ncbi:uncharacterized protein LOC107876421 [Capsicum annuum]|uniref:uncharacterized protein LOC107876421 n=1 Tax=Capsicum annuum TaxID=4072 RepID=UPI001FB17DDD|nr:uncharacterized protein LOC107876421 [Capsicum annuum]
MYEQVILESVDHLIQAVDDGPEEKMEEDPEENPGEDSEKDQMEVQKGELTEEMEEDPEEEEYGPIDFSGGADEDHRGSSHTGPQKSQYNLRYRNKMTNNDKDMMIAVDEPKSSKKLSDTQNDKQMANMAQKIEVLKKELRQMRDGPDVGLPHVAPANPTNLPHALAPPTFQPTVGTAPGYPFPTYNFTVLVHPEMQHIPDTYVTCEVPVPLIYATEVPIFATSAAIKISYEVERYAGLRRDIQSGEEGSMVAQLKSLKRIFKNMQVTRGTELLDYDDLCIHPNVDMPVGYKSPKFDIFDGKGDPHAHLRAYCNKFFSVRRNEKLRMKLFIRSLTGETLTWYTRQDPCKWRDWREIAEDFIRLFRFNTKIAPDRFSLANIQNNPSESFQEYAWRWTTEAARIQLPLDEKLVKMGDFIEEGIKSGKIQSMVALRAAKEEYGLEKPIVPTWNTEEIAIASPSQPFSTAQLREPITVQTYLPKVIATTLATGRFDYDTKAVPWDY